MSTTTTPEQVHTEAPKEEPKEVSKTPTEAPTAEPTKAPIEAAKEAPKEERKEVHTEGTIAEPTKAPVEAAKEIPKGEPKEVPKEEQKEAPKPVVATPILQEVQITDEGCLPYFFSVSFPFQIGGIHYFYGHSKEKHWQIQELVAAGKLGAKTDSGEWSHYYDVGFPFEIHGRSFFYGQSSDTKLWFIQELLLGGKMGKEESSGLWSHFYPLQFPFTIEHEVFFYGQRADGYWFIQELLANGKMGEEKSHGDGTFYELQFPFKGSERQFFYAQRKVTGTVKIRWVVEELLPGGKKGKVTSDDESIYYATALPFQFNNLQYFYFHDGKSKWQIFRVKPDGWAEAGEGTSEFFAVLFSYQIDGKLYLYGQRQWTVIVASALTGENRYAIQQFALQ